MTEPNQIFSSLGALHYRPQRDLDLFQVALRTGHIGLRRELLAGCFGEGSGRRLGLDVRKAAGLDGFDEFERVECDGAAHSSSPDTFPALSRGARVAARSLRAAFFNLAPGPSDPPSHRRQGVDAREETTMTPRIGAPFR